MAAPSAGPRKALTTAQESRLVRYLDDELYKLSGAFESRHSGTSRLPTLDAFLQALLPLHAFILTIPAVPPSGALRIAYYLNLTSFIAPALDGYTILDETLDSLFETLARFDRGWVAVLRGEDWDSTAGRARSEQTPRAPAGTTLTHGYAGGMRTTDRARLESLVKQIRAVLAISLGLPQFVPLENDPFLEMLQQRRDRPDLAGPLPNQFEEISAMRERDEDSSSASQAPTPSLLSDDTQASDADSAMSVDTVTDNLLIPARDQGVVVAGGTDDMEQDDEGDDADDVEFEEVAVVGNDLLSSHPLQREHLPNAIVDPPEPDGSFEIHYEIPPPALHDGEITLENGATPIVGQRRGFDPDSEYPLDEEEGDPIVPRRRGRRLRTGVIDDAAAGDGSEEEEEDDDDGVTEGEEVDGIEDSTRERLKHVFELTEQALAELKAADSE